MFEKNGKFFADWRDSDGTRHRKSFTTAALALEFEKASRGKAAPKKAEARGQHKALPASSRRSVNSPLRASKSTHAKTARRHKSSLPTQATSRRLPSLRRK